MTTFVFLSLTKIRPRFHRFLSSSFRHSFRFDLLKIYSNQVHFVLFSFLQLFLLYQFVLFPNSFFSILFASLRSCKSKTKNKSICSRFGLETLIDLQKAVISPWLLVCKASSAYIREYFDYVCSFFLRSCYEWAKLC
jgi:hypothetical protein